MSIYVLNTFCVVDLNYMFVHVQRHVQSKFILGGHEAILLVVNIVTSPISTDCGWSAPVVGLYRQGRGLFENNELLYIVEVANIAVSPFRMCT